MAEPVGGPLISSETPGRYQHGREHARGGMGRILLVHDDFLARRIALKELLPHDRDSGDGSTLLARDDSTDQATHQHQARFLNEARITGQLEHPSIVPVYELGRRENGVLYYTMRLVKGRSLRRAIKDAPSLGERLRLLPHFIDLCQAIAFAHSRGVIHRDIKPGNVMVGDYGETVVIDWGLGKADDPGSAEDAVARNAVAMGTPAYMAPEQAIGNLSETDERTDVYSLGAVLYELLTGASPYPENTPTEVLSNLLAGEPESVHGKSPKEPDQLKAICNHAMARDPDYRYQSAKELSNDIDRFLSGNLVGVYNYSLGELFAHFIREFKAPLTVGVIGMAAFLGVVFHSYQRIQTERDRALIESTRAIEAQRVAVAAQALAEQEFYFAAVLSARKYIADGRYQKAMEQLDKCPPQFRHWEWGYLLYLCNQDQQTLREHEPHTVWSLAYMPDGKHVVSSGFDDTVRISVEALNTAVRTYESPHGAVIELSPHPSDPIIVCAEENGYITLLDSIRGEMLHTWKASGEDINCIQFNPAGEVFVSGDDEGYLRMWDYKSRTERYAVATEDGSVEAIAFSPRSDQFASCDRGTRIALRNTADGTVQRYLEGHAGRITCLSYDSGGNRLASASRDGSVRIWNLTTGVEERILTDHGTAAVWAVVFSPDGTKMASASSDLTERLWSTETWSAERIYRGHQKQVYCLAFSPDGRMLFSGDDEGTMKQWDTDFPGPRSDMWELSGHTGIVNNVAFSADGAVMATSAGHWKHNDDTTARIWDANSGAMIKTLAGHGASVRYTAFHPTASIYATSSHDKTIRIWDRDTHSTIRVLGPFDDGVNVVAYAESTPDLLAA
jgi:eukaryotic-like serine/threonine-protein kinase